MDKLKEIRKTKKSSQKYLAKKLGVTQGAISQWERGESRPNTENLIELSRVLHCSIEDLLF